MKNLVGQAGHGLNEIMAELELSDRNFVHQRVVEAFYNAGFLVGNDNALVGTASPRMMSYLQSDKAFSATVRVDISGLTEKFAKYAQDSLDAIIGAPVVDHLPVKMVGYQKDKHVLQLMIKRDIG
jgi:hypothetical protein